MMQLLQYFKELSLHPNNAAELKGLILQLAVQGKLTAQWRTDNPDVEPAAKLLERIKTEKAKLVKEKKIKKEEPLPKVSKNEIPFGLPESWTWCRLGDAAMYIQRGKSPKYTELKKYPVIAQKCVQWSGMEMHKAKFLDPDALKKYGPERIVRTGDLLWNSTGRGSLGRVGVFHEDCHEYELAVADSHVTVIRFILNMMDPNYVFGYLSSPIVQNVIESRSSGSTNQIELATSTVKETVFPLPPLEEQKAIVAIVEQLFEEVEQLEKLTEKRLQIKQDFVTSALQKLTTEDTQTEWAFLAPHFKTFFTEEPNVAKLREAILQLAVQGKLTKKWRSANQNIEPASKLLERIQAEKAKLLKEKKIKKEEPLSPITEDEIPYELPEGWVWCRMGEVHNVKSSKRVFKSDYVKNGVPFFRSKEIGQLGRGEEITTELFISRDRFEEFKVKFGLPKKGDVMIACIGGSIGNTWLVDEREFYYKDGNLVQVDSISEVDSYYLLKFLESELFYQSALGRVSGSAYNALTIEKIKNSVFPFPPIKEQKAIVAIVEQLFELCDKLDQAIQNNQTTQEQWMQSCLKEVFEEPKDVLV